MSGILRPDTRLLTTGDIAALYDVSRRTAWRWLRAAYRSHGPRVVKRIKGKTRDRYMTTRAGLAEILPGVPLTDGERRLRAVEEKGQEHDRRLAAQAEELKALRETVAEFRRKSHEWMTRARENA